MNLFDEAILELWKSLNNGGVRYILVGGFATNLHGFQRFTGDVDLFIEDTLSNRKKLRAAYSNYSGIDFEGFETIQFVPGWIDFPLNNNIRLDILTSLKGVTASFDECFQMANTLDIEDVKVPVLHINHLIANKKAVNRPKDQLDVLELEKIKALTNEQNTSIR